MNNTKKKKHIIAETIDVILQHIYIYGKGKI